MTPPCFPQRPSRWPALPPIGARSNERRAAWTTPARPPHVSLLSPRRWHEEILTRRRFTCYCALAFEQESKNAWKVEDYATIEDALRKALGEACTALRLDPRNADARLQVAVLQDKLIRSRLRNKETAGREQGRSWDVVPIAHFARGTECASATRSPATQKSLARPADALLQGVICPRVCE